MQDLELRVQRLERALLAALRVQLQTEAKLMALQERLGHLLWQVPLAEADADFVQELLRPRVRFHFQRLLDALAQSQPELAVRLREDDHPE